MGPRHSNDPEACPTQRGVQSQDDLMLIGAKTHAGFKYRSRGTCRTAQALFHVFELLRRDSHHGHSASEGKGSKGENTFNPFPRSSEHRTSNAERRMKETSA